MIHTPRRRLALAALALTLLAACDEPTGPRIPTSLQILDGDLQNDTVGQMLPQALAVRVTDDGGKPVAGTLVNFVVVEGGGAMFAGSGLTDANGEVRDRWQLGTVAGDTQRVEARAVNSETGAPIVFATFRAVGLPDAPSTLEAVTPAFGREAGSTVPLEARVSDRFGNAVPGVTVAWTAEHGAVSLASSQTDAQGVARTDWTLGGTPGNQTARASAARLAQATFTAIAGVGPPMGIRIEPAEVRFTSLGDISFVYAESFDRFGNPTGRVAAQFTSLDPNIVSVNATTDPVRINAVSNGTARLVATFGQAADTVEVVVRQEVGTIQMHPDSMFVLVGESFPFTTTLRDLAGYPVNDVPVAFTSSAPGVVSVSAAGTATAAAPGSASVTASAGARQDVSRVEVFVPFAAQTVDAGNELSCAVRADGTAWCWGSNYQGRLGSGTGGFEQRTPVQVAGGHDWVDVQGPVSFAGSTCGLTRTGQAYCWGPGEGIGNTTFKASATPSPVAGGRTFVKISVGGRTNCGLVADGRAFCWGQGRYGTLGNGDTIRRAEPVRVASSEAFIEIASGAQHSCALTVEGYAWCWGYNGADELGVPGDRCFDLIGPGCSSTPVAVSGGMKFVQLVAGNQFTCGLAAGGAAYCWGGMGTSGPLPTAVPGGHAFSALTAGYSHVCGRTSGGEAWCWGSGPATGSPGSEPVQTPVHAAPALSFTSLNAGQGQTCGVATDGFVYCWGRQVLGEMGDGWLQGYRVEPRRVHTR